MAVGVIGGTGMIGKEVVRLLAGQGDEVRILTRSAPSSMPPGVSHSHVDLSTGEGLERSLAGLETVIDVGNTRKDPKQTLVGGTRRVLEECDRAGVGHYAGISIVGAGEVGIAYYRAKVEQEEVIRNAPIGWSLLMATQFHELLDMLFRSSARWRITPSVAIPVQPVAAAVAARTLTDIACSGPSGQSADLVGPQVSTIAELGGAWCRANHRHTLKLPLPLIGRSARTLREGGLTRPGLAGQGPSFAEWLGTA